MIYIVDRHILANNHLLTYYFSVRLDTRQIFTALKDMIAYIVSCTANA